jgi:CRISPR-associated protein Cas1
MKRLLNTLYVTTPNAYLSRDGETVLVRVEQETKLRVPIHTLGGIVCFGPILCSPPCMELCAENGVALSFLSEHGRFLARVHGRTAGNVLLRRAQYRAADDPGRSAELARSFVLGKVANGRTVLLRALRERGEPDEALAQAEARLGRVLGQLRGPAPLDTVRGLEGDAGRAYFGAFDRLITAQKEAFHFRERSRRPPLDNVNALLSFLYTLLAHDVGAALEGVGLDPAVGFLHRDRPGRPGLALDLMEEFRPFLADRLALSLINRQQVRPQGFTTSETGAVAMDDDTRKALLVAYQKRKQEEIQHPFLGEKMPLGLLPHAQALLLARHLRGELDAYPPFLWK